MSRILTVPLILALLGVATVYAQKPSDSPFAPSGNPFVALGAQLSVISSKLDAVLKGLNPPQPAPPAEPTAKISTGYIEINDFDDAACMIANVGDATITNVHIRFVGTGGEAFLEWDRGPLDSGQGTAVSTNLYAFGGPWDHKPMRCEFAFDGSADAVRGTINVRRGPASDESTFILDAR
jgi:hypothetical protein